MEKYRPTGLQRDWPSRLRLLDLARLLQMSVVVMSMPCRAWEVYSVWLGSAEASIPMIYGKSPMLFQAAMEFEIGLASL